jgi:hypothetical protein
MTLDALNMALWQRRPSGGSMLIGRYGVCRLCRGGRRPGHDGKLLTLKVLPAIGDKIIVRDAKTRKRKPRGFEYGETCFRL